MPQDWFSQFEPEKDDYFKQFEAEPITKVEPEIKPEIKPKVFRPRPDESIFSLDFDPLYHKISDVASKLPEPLQWWGGALGSIPAYAGEVLSGILGQPETPALGAIGAARGALPKIAGEVATPEVTPRALLPERALSLQEPTYYGGPTGEVAAARTGYLRAPNIPTAEQKELTMSLLREPEKAFIKPATEFRREVTRSPQIVMQARNLESAGAPSNLANTAAEVAFKNPELSQAINDPSFVQRFLHRETPTSRFVGKMTSSIDTELSTQHPQLGELVKQTQVDSHIKSGTWISRYDNVIDKLNDKEFTNFVDSIEGKARPDSEKIAESVRRYKLLDSEISNEMTNSGAGLRSKDGTKQVPWQPRENYWPHMYTEDFFDTLKRDPTDIRARLTEKGMAPAEIDALLNNAKRFGERLIDAQHARETNLPGYRVDKDVYRQHITEMSRRITESNNYGPMDLADNESPLMDLIRRTKNPEYSTEMMKKLLNRGQVGDYDSIDISRKATAMQAWLHLSTSGISNLNTTAMIPIQTNTKSFVKGLTDTIFRSQESGEFAKESGALQNIFREIFAAAIKDSKFSPTKLYGLDEGEKFMRTISSSAGRSYAKQLFNEVKAGNANPLNLKKLQDLTLTNPTELMKQTELNPMQIKRAAFRTAELTQGLAEPQNMPQYWTGSGLANLLTLFHKYQFAQTKIIKDLVMSNPVRSIPMLLGASQIAGEMTGDAKALIRGLVRTGVTGEEKVSEEIAGRQEFIQKRLGIEDPLIARFAENMAQSFALGIYADVIESLAGGGGEVLRSLAGSALNDLMRVVDIGKDVVKGDFQKATTKGTRFVPFIGPPIAREMQEAERAR